MRRIKPLTGQVLIEVLPPDTKSAGGIDIPDSVQLSADEVQEQSHDPQKPRKPNIGIVRACGAWRQLPNKMLLLPEFAVGARVMFDPWKGTELRENGKSMRMLKQDDVLAVLTESV